MAVRDRVWAWARNNDRALWIAGYPRSGATLTRMVLAHHFGMVTDTVYNESYLGDYYSAAVRAASWPESDTDAATLDDMAERFGRVAVKTHEPPVPGDTTRAIVVIRDPRSALASLQELYAMMLHRILSDSDMIVGWHAWGNWSDWIRWWRPVQGCLWLRYEDLRDDRAVALETIGKWLGQEPREATLPPFGEFHKRNWMMFPRGDRPASIAPGNEQLFWATHGETMRLLGYEKET